MFLGTYTCEAQDALLSFSQRTYPTFHARVTSVSPRVSLHVARARNEPRLHLFLLVWHGRVRACVLVARCKPGLDDTNLLGTGVCWCEYDNDDDDDDDDDDVDADDDDNDQSQPLWYFTYLLYTYLLPAHLRLISQVHASLESLSLSHVCNDLHVCVTRTSSTLYDSWQSTKFFRSSRYGTINTWNFYECTGAFAWSLQFGRDIIYIFKFLWWTIIWVSGCKSVQLGMMKSICFMD